MALPNRARTSAFDARMGGRSGSRRARRARTRFERRQSPGRGGGGYGGGGRGGWGGEARQATAAAASARRVGAPQLRGRRAQAQTPPDARRVRSPRRGRQVRRLDDYDTDTSDDDPDHLSEYVTDDSEDQPDADDPNVDDARDARRRHRIRLDRGADDREDPRGTPVQPRALSDDDSDDDDDDDWAPSSPRRRRRRGLQRAARTTTTTRTSPAPSPSVVMAPTTPPPRWASPEQAYPPGCGPSTRRRGRHRRRSPCLFRLRLRGRNDALVNGNYGAYSWSRGAGARFASRPGTLGSQRETRGEEGAKRRDVAENRPTSTKSPGPPSWQMLRMMILSGGSGGVQPAIGVRVAR